MNDNRPVLEFSTDTGNPDPDYTVVIVHSEKERRDAVDQYPNAVVIYEDSDLSAPVYRCGSSVMLVGV